MERFYEIECVVGLYHDGPLKVQMADDSWSL